MAAEVKGLVMEHGRPKWPKVILFGDSLTQYCFGSDGCWGALLADHLQRKCDVISRGFSGYNSRWCKLILPTIITKQDAADIVMVTIFLGANDSVDKDIGANQHVPLEEYKEHLISMVEYLQAVGLKKEQIILIAPPTCDEANWGQHCKIEGRELGKFNEPIASYAKSCVEVASRCEVSCIDLYSRMSEIKDWKNLLNDGLHLSTSGSHLLFDMLLPVINKCISSLPNILPDWNDIDNENPQVALKKYMQ